MDMIRLARAHPKTWTVDDDGTADFSTIQEAINNASSGDTILVKAGVYYERVSIGKSLTVVGEDPKTTIINGRGQTYAVKISKENVTFSGFTVMNITWFWGYGIGIVGKNNVTLCNNIVRDCYVGISLYPSNYSKIFNNIIISCTYGIDFFLGSYNNTITHNTIINNNVGVYIRTEETRYNRFYFNAFNNTEERILGTNFWDNGTVGNYWSDYRGIDVDGDGIGDTPHELNPPEYDYKPLVVPPFGVPILWQNKLYYITFETHSTILRPCYDSALKLFRFYVNGTYGSEGYCNLTVPNALFNTPYFILLGDMSKSPEAEIPINSTHTALYFTYYHTPTSLKVTIVPEFSSPMLLSLLLLTALVAIFLAKTKKGLVKLRIP
jgi:parallel beta-helix repeat protein